MFKEGDQVNSEEKEVQPLNCDMDAKRWAKEFMSSKFTTNLPPEVDESLMLAWFANAIMCGWDNAHWKLQKEQPPVQSAGVERSRAAEFAVMKTYDLDNRECSAGKIVAVEKERDTWEQHTHAERRKRDSATKALGDAVALLRDAKALIDHAIELGHLGDGSTRGWANDIGTRLDAFLQANGGEK